MIVSAGSSRSTGSVSFDAARASRSRRCGRGARTRPAATAWPDCGAHPANSSSIFSARFCAASCGVSLPRMTFWISPSKMFAPSSAPHRGDGGYTAGVVEQLLGERLAERVVEVARTP